MMTKSFRTLTLGSLLCAAAVGLALTASGCVVDTGPGNGNGYGYGCQSDLFVDWQIENLKGGFVTCAAAGAATVVIDIDGTPYPQTCESIQTSGSQDIPLQANYATYDVTVSLEDASGYPLATPQVTSVNVTSCGSYRTPGPATLVVTPTAQ
jgi:hypothetical protein